MDLNNELDNAQKELQEIRGKSRNHKKGRSTALGLFANKLVLTLFFLLVLVILFFPYNKYEYTIGNEKTIISYNPISKTCVTLELTKEIDDKQKTEYYKIKTKGSGHINIIKDEKGNKYYMCYGLASVSFDEILKKEFITDDINIFTVLKIYFFSSTNDRFLEQTLPS